MMQHAPKESKRFGLNVYRDGYCRSLDIEKMETDLRKNQVDVYIFRWPAEQQSRLYELNILGVPYIVADTLVVYGCDLGKHPVPPIKNEGLSFRLAQPKDAALVGDLTERIFEGYKNHYDANPWFDKKAILEAYKEWALGYIMPDSQESAVFLAEIGGKPAGFAACSFVGAESSIEGVLYGVLPEFKGGGLYADFVRFTQAYGRSRGLSAMSVSTQVVNYAVQKVWAREGFHISQAWLTVHVNPGFGVRATT